MLPEVELGFLEGCVLVLEEIVRAGDHGDVEDAVLLLEVDEVFGGLKCYVISTNIKL